MRTILLCCCNTILPPPRFVQTGIMIGGGRRNHVKWNHFEDCDTAIEFDNRGKDYSGKAVSTARNARASISIALVIRGQHGRLNGRTILQYVCVHARRTSATGERYWRLCMIHVAHRTGFPATLGCHPSQTPNLKAAAQMFVKKCRGR